MTNTEMLEKRIKQSGYKVTYLARSLGLSYSGFHKKVKNKSSFTSTEINKLKNLLQLSVWDLYCIFFPLSATKTGERLRRLRGDRSQSEVAEAIGTSAEAISFYENDERVPRDEIKVRLARYYLTTVDAIFYS